MPKPLNIKRFLLVLLIIGAGCKKPYAPPATSTNYNYLVVEGIINTGTDSTIIQLSRTVTIGTQISANPEIGAIVTVEGDQNTSYPLKNTNNGKYVSAGLNLDNTHQYRLRIKTSDNKQYLSDFVQAKVSPPIDSVTFAYAGTQENIFSYTHDATNNSRYYRWEYSETYLYYSPIHSMYIFTGTNVVHSTPQTQIDTCYISDNSSNVILNSSAKLSQDVIDKNPLTQIPFNIDKLKVRYSILVKQYVLTPDAYNFYTALAKNTENLGTIFSAQPTELVGNIHCITNPAEPVIGYVSAGTISQKRIFIDRGQIPPTLIGTDYTYCTEIVPGEALPNITWTGSYNFFPDIIRLYTVAPTGPILKAYDPIQKDSTFDLFYRDEGCTVCTTKGTNEEPSFWIDP